MITVSARSSRYLRENKKAVGFVLVLYTLSFCLLAQMLLGFVSFYFHQMTGDEISIFAEPEQAEAVKKNLNSQFSVLSPRIKVSELDSKEVIAQELLSLVQKKGKVPAVFTVSFPVTTPFATIETEVRKIESMKGVSLVSANLDWIKKRQSLRKAIALGVAAFGIPAIALVGFVILVCVARLNTSLQLEQALLLMLGGSAWTVRGTVISITAFEILVGGLLGSLLYLLTTGISVPLIESAFEITLMPSYEQQGIIYLCLTLAMMVFACGTAYFYAGKTKPLQL